MRVLIQRVKSASVIIEGEKHSSISKGLLLFVGVSENDTEKDALLLVDKLIHLRIFEDNQQKINLSILDKKYDILSVSQYSLYANYQKGRRPSFTENASIKKAMYLYNYFNDCLSNHIILKTGVFQAKMEIELVNDGPFTLLLDSEVLKKN